MSSPCGISSEGLSAGGPGLPGLLEGFEDSHDPSPPPSSLSETGSFSPPTYPPVFPLSSSLALSARFPPPPPSSFVQPVPEVTYSANSNYAPESHSAFDRWSDRAFASASAYGEGSLPKRFTQWAFPAYDSGDNNNKGNSSGGLGDFRPESGFLSLAPYPSRDSLAGFGPKLPDALAFPNAAVMASNSSAPIAVALPSGHLAAFSQPNQLMEFPNSSPRFPFNPYAPTFVPAGVAATSAFDTGNAEYGPEPVPSYLSFPGLLLSPSTVQASSHFFDGPSFPTRSQESPVGPKSSSGFVEPHYLEGDPVIENCDFAAASNLPYPPPLSETLFSSFPSATSLEQNSVGNIRGLFGPQAEQKRADRIAIDAGKPNYQHMSVDEWRWMQYQRMVLDELDSSTSSRRVYPPRYGSFPAAVECLDSNSSHGLEGKHENVSGGQRGQKGWLSSSKGIPWACNSTVPEAGNVLESKDAFSLGPLVLGQPNDEGEQFVEQDPSRWESEFLLHNSYDVSGNRRDGSALDKIPDQKEPHERQGFVKADNPAHPSLKEAASALAEALSSPEFSVPDAACSHQNALQGIFDDHCSSTGSTTGHKEVKDRHKLGDGDMVLDGYSSRGPLLHSPTGPKRDIHSQIEDAFCEFRGAPATWAVPRAADHSPTSAQPRQKNFFDGMPQSAKGGPLRIIGQRRVFSNASPGIMRQPLLPLGSASSHGGNAKGGSSDYLNSMFAQSFDASTRSPMDDTKSLISQNGGGESFDEPKTSVPPVNVTPLNFAPFDSHDGISVSRGPSGLMPLGSSHSDHFPDNSSTFEPSPLFSQSYAETEAHKLLTGKDSTSTSGTVGDSKSVAPDNSIEPGFMSSGTGVLSLAASISNLSKVLCSLHTLSVPPADIKELVENVQSSILRLSECLVLEQLGGNEKPTSSLYKTGISSATRHEKGEGVCETLDQGQRTVSRGPEVACHGQGAHPHIIDDNIGVKLPNTLADLVAGDRVGPHHAEAIFGSTRADSGHQPFISGENLHSGLRSLDVTTSGGVHKILDGSTSASIREMIADYECMGGNVIDRSFLERIVAAATEREAKLKAQVEDLEEQLDQERAENRGAAFLCEKILQEAGADKGKAAGWHSEGVIHHDLNEKSACNVNPDSRTSSITQSSAFMDYSKAVGRNRADHDDDGDLGFLKQANSHDQDSNIHLQRSPDVQGSLSRISSDGASRILGEYGAESVSLGSSKGLALNSDQGDSHVPNLAPVLPWDCLQEMSNSVEARLELLRARSEAAASLNTSHEAWGDLDFQLPVTSPASSSPVPWHESILDRTTGTLPCEPLIQSAIVDPQGPTCNSHLLNAEELSNARESRVKDGTDLEPRISGLNSAGCDLEARLALLQRRPSYSEDVEKFTDTVSYTAGGESETANSGRPVGVAQTGATEELAAKALEVMSHITSQLLIQSETICNMRTLWDQFSEQANSKTLEMMSSSGTDFPLKVRGNESFFSSSILDSGAVENGLVTSRDSWKGDHAPGPEDFLGAETCKLSSSTSGNAQCDAEKFEASSEVSLVRLLDSDFETAVSLLPIQQQKEQEHSSNPEASADSLVRLLDLDVETAASFIPSTAPSIPTQEQSTHSAHPEKSEVEVASVLIPIHGQSTHSSDKTQSDVEMPAFLIPSEGLNTPASDPEMFDVEKTIEKVVLPVPAHHQMTYTSNLEKSAASNGFWGKSSEGSSGSRPPSSNSQDTEDEASWEHVRHPQDESD